MCRAGCGDGVWREGRERVWEEGRVRAWGRGGGGHGGECVEWEGVCSVMKWVGSCSQPSRTCPFLALSHKSLYPQTQAFVSPSNSKIGF